MEQRRLGQRKREKQSSWKDDKGKGKVCYTCGKPGHVAKDCWRVRQVAENPQFSTPSTGGGTSNAARDDASAAVLLTNPSRASVKRFSQTSLDPFVVNLRELDEDGGVIRAVTFFFMEEDEPRELSAEIELSVSAVWATADADDGYLQSEEHLFPVVWILVRMPQSCQVKGLQRWDNHLRRISSSSWCSKAR